MNNYRFFTLTSLFILIFFISARSQDRPVGQWRSHLPYNSAVSLASDGKLMYVASGLSFFTYDMATGEMIAYSKTSGMTDVEMSYIGYDAYTGKTILGYQNSNVDIFKNNTFENIPFLKKLSATGSKLIYNIYSENGLAYLSTGIGVMVINLQKEEVKETYTFTVNSQILPTKGFITYKDSFYVVTSKGLYRASRNHPNLQDFASAWKQVGGPKNLNGITAAGGKLFVTGIDSLYVLEQDTLRYLYRSNNKTNHIDGGNKILYMCALDANNLGRVYKMNMNYQMIDSVKLGLPLQVCEVTDSTYYVADQYGGLTYKSPQQERTILPEGPYEKGAYGIYAENKEVWIAHGGYTDLFVGTGNRSGISIYNDNWRNYSQNTSALIGDSTVDYVNVTKNPVDGSLWAGSMRTGLFILKPDGQLDLIYRGDVLENLPLYPNDVPVTGIAADKNGNMWINQHGAPDQLAVRTKDGNWYHFNINFNSGIPNAAAGVVVDDANQKWYYTPRSVGVVVYNDNNTIENSNDDLYMAFGTSDGLPGNETTCLAKDRDGAIWVGTDNGVARFTCPESAVTGGCKPEVPKVQFDQFAGFLFQNERVNTIAVDGANRKWVGTNNGIWLVSPDGDNIIYRFTSDNSPLPSNQIAKIAVDAITGDVYIGTSNGLVSFRSTATDGAEKNDCNASVFPNPVESGYKGTIAIRNLVEDADVRITDISGQMVFRTKALGGQAVWNGLDYTGRRPQSGVYLIFITDKQGVERKACKMVFME